LRINRVARRSHANRLNLTGGGRASVVRQALTTPPQEHLRPLDARSTGEQSRERLFTQPDALLDERDGAGDRILNRRLIHSSSYEAILRAMTSRRERSRSNSRASAS